MTPKLPYYMAYPMPLAFDDEWLERRDHEYMKSMYPDTAKRILPYVEEECDRCEHPCSMMYDEYPDRLQLRMMTNRIYQNVMDNERSLFGMESEYEDDYKYEAEEVWNEDEEDVYAEEELGGEDDLQSQQQFRRPGRPPQRPLQRPPVRPPHRPPVRPPQRPDNLRDLIEILLFEELQRRRNQQRRSRQRRRIY